MKPVLAPSKPEAETLAVSRVVSPDPAVRLPMHVISGLRVVAAKMKVEKVAEATRIEKLKATSLIAERNAAVGELEAALQAHDAELQLHRIALAADAARK